jgi:hypothetical protein
MATMKSLEAAVRRKYGNRSYVRHNRHAKLRAGREALSRELSAMNARAKEIAVTTERVERSWRRLVKAAQFVTDTDGDRTAVEQLRHPVAEAAALIERQDEVRQLRKEIRERGGRAHQEPYEVYTVNETIPGFPIAVQECAGDTIDEVLAKVRNGGR